MAAEQWMITENVPLRDLVISFIWMTLALTLKKLYVDNAE